MNGISSISGYASYAYAQGISGNQKHGGSGDLFNKIDTDGSGGVSQSELEAFVVNLSSASGKTIDTTDAISTYDTDGDGELSSTELKSFMDANRPEQPPMGMMGMSGSQDTSSDLFSSITDDAISTYDTDGDGKLSSTELKSFFENSASKLASDFILKALSAYTTDGYGSSTSGSMSLEA